MDIENLLEFTTEDLLDKFGAGNHKPGSGSAAAFQGMLSAKLLVTVISLTNGRANYEKVLPKLIKMSDEIHFRIFPELVKLFQEDAVQFGVTISAREKRNKETNALVKNQLSIKALDELKTSVDIPIAISKLCIELAEISVFVFDNAFQSARGDSQVALSGAVAGLAGSISIIQLNLLSFNVSEYSWTTKIILETNIFREKLLELNDLSFSKIQILADEVKFKIDFQKKVNLLLEIKSRNRLTNSEIEKVAIAFQNLMWVNRDKIWNRDIPDHPVKILNPSVALKKCLGYNCEILPNIGIIENNNSYSEIAGLINQKDKIVLISNNYAKNIQNFTAAHELGHAILHNQNVMHRDRPLDGAMKNDMRNLQEIQADKFATYFLMPAKIVKQIFFELFLTDKFLIDEDSAINLIQNSPSKLKYKCRNLRGLSLELATAERYNNQSFRSISELFGVSKYAMAIRLEELNLLDF
ncbi:cyclodeaminase/cyclohydrolase family protein [Flavobacterium sp. GP15]|uniref:cyclodeaminase/cyclohydrolase family protein n=1 Tax=Flavobacterium sp. GP15 TaxID=2758567 RepID=UPI00165D82E0|nr:cyclodeaminase/cyclohydrolase family protein [Flavobacterium sp. GP15]